MLNIKKDIVIGLFMTKRWPWHALFWLVYFFVSLPEYIKSFFKVDKYLYINFLGDIFLITITYSIVLIFYPLFFKKEKYVQYIIYIVCWILLLDLLESFIIKKWYDFIPDVHSYNVFDLFLGDITILMFYGILITMCKICKDFFIKHYIEKEQKNIQNQYELDNLKAQLSPHFLFNTMNNFYGLAVSQSKQLPDLMLRLSELMRYSLYGTDKPQVLLSDELNYLKNYIELERIRLEDSLKLEFKTDIDETKHYKIAPLLFIVFIENAFKHSKKNKNSIIDIKIDIKTFDNNDLIFTINNYYAPLYENEVNKGIGIENIKKRLEILYPNDTHNLKIQNLNDVFFIQLKIKLQN